ncbi:MAG TPA: DUF4097 family beta strand repeat-containing protein [Terriglobales bacterium]|nr:DUF4097 family beta strand repeat-containing protein [Terriglobales bacterium]
MKFRSRLLLTCVMTCAALLAMADSRSEGSFDRTLSVSGPVDLDVETGAGSIEVRSGSSASVVIHGRIRVNGLAWFSGDPGDKVERIEKKPPIEQNGNSIRIGRTHESSLFQNISISYVIETPAQTRLTSQTGSGTQTVAGVNGPVHAKTGSGSVRVEQTHSDIEATTGSGAIDLNDIHGGVRANAGSGSIRAHGIAGSFRATTGSGNIDLVQSSPGYVDAQAGSGSLRLENIQGNLHASTGSGSITAGGQPSGSWDLRSGSGSISVRVPGDARFDLYAHTSSGSLQLDVPVEVQGEISKREIRGKVRGGGSFALNVHTGSGSIRIQ